MGTASKLRSVLSADAPVPESQSRGNPRMGPITFASLVVAARVLYVGGYSNTSSSNALNYGLSYANANNSLSNSNTNIGSRLDRSSALITVSGTPPKGEISEATSRVSTDYGNTGWEDEGL